MDLLDDITLFLSDRLPEVAGLIIGLIYLYYEYHANPKVWICGIIMPAISMYVYFNAGLYADFGINIYYLLAAVYGYMAWRRPKDKKPLLISHIPARVVFPTLGAIAVFWLIIYLILIKFTDSTVPVWDALTTAMSIVGLWLMARKFVEQWWLWIIVDAICVILYAYKGIYFYAVLYAAYTVIAFLGYCKWLRLIPEPAGDRPVE